MYVTWQTIITVAAVMTAILTILGLVLKVHKWYLEQQRQSTDILNLKKENRLHMEALSACLDGLMQLGVNHSVPEVKRKLDEYLNNKAHQ